MEFKDKTAVVTGAGSGLGHAYALGLAKEGASVVVVDIDENLAAKTAAELIADGLSAIGIGLDVADDDAVAGMVEKTKVAYGRLDILVNNAAWRPFPAGEHYGFPSVHFPTEMTTSDWLRVLAVNVVAPITCARACRSLMAAQGGGVIVNQSSMGAYTSSGSPYGVTKHALNSVTVGLAKELAADGIRVNGIAPGMMTGPTGSVREKSADARTIEHIEHILDRQLIKRRGTPEDLVNTLLFLCSSHSSFITGETIHVDGGVTLRI